MNSCRLRAASPPQIPLDDQPAVWAQDLVGLPKLPGSPVPRPPDWPPISGPLARINIGLLHPLVQRLARADLGRDRHDRRPAQRMFMFVTKHQSHGALAPCRGNLFVVLLTMAPPSQQSESPANQGRFSSRSDGPSSYAASLLLTGNASRIAPPRAIPQAMREGRSWRKRHGSSSVNEANWVDGRSPAGGPSILPVGSSASRPRHSTMPDITASLIASANVRTPRRRIIRAR